VKTHLAYTHNTNALKTHGLLLIFSRKRKSRAINDAPTGFYQPVYVTSRAEIKEPKRRRGDKKVAEANLESWGSSHPCRTEAESQGKKVARLSCESFGEAQDKLREASRILNHLQRRDPPTISPG
jgi:hypothetical protein